MMLKLTVFSQKSTVDTILVKSFPMPVVKEIIKDLMRGDSAIAELNLTKKELELCEKNHVEKDSIISNYKLYETKSIEVIAAERERYKVMDERFKELQTNFNAVKTTNKIISVAGIGVIGIIVGILIAN